MKDFISFFSILWLLGCVETLESIAILEPLGKSELANNTGILAISFENPDSLESCELFFENSRSELKKIKMQDQDINFYQLPPGRYYLDEMTCGPFNFSLDGNKYVRNGKISDFGHFHFKSIRSEGKELPEHKISALGYKKIHDAFRKKYLADIPQVKLVKSKERTKVRGGLSIREFEIVVRAHLNELSSCHIITAPSHIGVMTFRIIIGANGRVVSSKFLNGKFENKLVDCMNNTISGWPFLKPKGGQEAIIEYPFEFSRSDST